MGSRCEVGCKNCLVKVGAEKPYKQISRYVYLDSLLVLHSICFGICVSRVAKGWRARRVARRGRPQAEGGRAGQRSLRKGKRGHLSSRCLLAAVVPEVLEAK